MLYLLIHSKWISLISGTTCCDREDDLANAKKHLSAFNKQLHQLWYRSIVLHHIISLLDQIEGIAKVCPTYFQL